MALLVRVDGTTENVMVPKDDTSLEFLQKAVGGYIEMVPVINPEVAASGLTNLFCDEEGKLKNKPVNEKATLMAGRDRLPCIDPICGDALFFAEGEVD